MKKLQKFLLTAAFLVLPVYPLHASDTPLDFSKIQNDPALRGQYIEKTAEMVLEKLKDPQASDHDSILFVMTWILQNMDRKINEMTSEMTQLMQGNNPNKKSIEELAVRLKLLSEKRARIAQLLIEALQKSAQQPATSLGR